MKYIKSFNESVVSDLAKEIADDIFPRLSKIKDQGEKITVEYFEKYMKDRGADPNLTHEVMNNLVSMGLNFESLPQEDSSEYGEPYLKP